MIIAKRTLRASVFLLALVMAIYLLWLVRSGLYPFIIALLLAYILNPAVCWLERKGLKRLWSIIILYLVLFGIFIFGGIILIPLLIRELESFGKELPQIMLRAEEFLQWIQIRYQNSSLPHSLRVSFDEALWTLQVEAQNTVAAVVSGLLEIVTHFIGLAISPILAFYLLHDWYEIKEQFLRLLPGRWRHEAISFFRDVDKVLSGVIRGQVSVAMIVGILVSFGLYYLQVPFALLIGILAGMLDVIPYFGAVIGATPAVTLAFLESPWLAVKVIILFFLIHQLEGTVIGPKILGEKVGLHPLTVIFVLFIGGEMAGLVGMLLAVPVTAVGKVLVRHLVTLLV